MCSFETEFCAKFFYSTSNSNNSEVGTREKSSFKESSKFFSTTFFVSGFSRYAHPYGKNIQHSLFFPQTSNLNGFIVWISEKLNKN